MQIVIQRETDSGVSVIGSLSVNGSWECYTLEHPSGDPLQIPAGDYQVILWNSPKFGRVMPRLVGPGDAGRDPIEIHFGNTVHNTEGCVIVGATKAVDSVGNSQAAFAKLFPLIQGAINQGEAVTASVRNPD